MQAMILAAGYGTRLRPYTLIRPKPLFPVLNRPLLPATIERLRNSGCRRIIVNCHHLAGQIGAALAGLAGVELQEEPAILGTGGSLAQVLDRIDPGAPLLVCNGDIYHTVDVAALYRQHCAGGLRITMALHHYPRFSKVLVRDGLVTAFDAPAGSAGTCAYTGIQVIDPQVLRTMDERRPYCIIDHYRQLLAGGEAIGAAVVAAPNWSDIGTVADYLGLHGDLLSGRKEVWPELQRHTSSSFVVDDQAVVAAGCRFNDWVCIGKARIGPGARISRSVLWDGAEVPPHTVVEDRLVVAVSEAVVGTARPSIEVL
ncbi:nucleotidyltransferase family protein [Desulfofustis limnaeus]|jgi:mannose-1-phosphate guanylyltransferase|uniref:Mannose-1-phosphate guanylyltransferase n=1 Tax=Desulfofustis limnaeus TaxID=2740163 RepID=A0ABN6M4M8_9BACT|nr:sugar phosphate nucleotidyltransferase [Desulfofustis limnaeus]BDD86835.1 mannose-1-phosphate guanylyltransferase [Desulfofustis limnaeus]